jgi:outer membrane protein OmpA-like peptidoglycan-associated protein
MEVEESTLSSSLTDMMTSLMVIFVLLLANYLRQEQGAADLARSKTDEMREELMRRLIGSSIQGVEVLKLDNYNLVVIVPEDKLQFAEGNQDLNEKAVGFLNEFTPLLLETYANFADDVSLINVEGHTDRKLKKDARNQFFNWDLSQSRASAVMKFMFTFPDKAAEVSRFQGIALFGGRGPIECPYDVGAPEEQRKMCRTVKFKIRLKSNEETKQQVGEAPSADGNGT